MLVVVNAAQAHITEDEDENSKDEERATLSQVVHNGQPIVLPRNATIPTPVPTGGLTRLYAEQHSDHNKPRAAFVNDNAHLESSETRDASLDILAILEAGLFGDCGPVLASPATPQHGVLLLHAGEACASPAELSDVVERATRHRKLILYARWGQTLDGYVTRMLNDLKGDVAKDDAVASLCEDSECEESRVAWLKILSPATSADLDTLRALSNSTSGVRYIVACRPAQRAQRGDVLAALSRWVIKWLSTPAEEGGGTVKILTVLESSAVLKTLFSIKVSKAISLAKHVDHMPLLLMVNRSYTTVCADAPSIIEEYHKMSNEVCCLADWKKLSTRLGVEENELSNLWVFASNWMGTNSNLRVLTSGGAGGGGQAGYSMNPVIKYLESPTTWADRIEVADGDGVNLFYRLPDHLREYLPAGRVASSSAMSLDDQGDLKVVGRMVFIDAPEWKQPFLVAKRILMYLVETPNDGRSTAVCSVRIKKAYYANKGRVFAEFVITAARPTSAATDQAGATVCTPFSPPTPPPPNEVSLHMLLLAAGAVYLMPQYFWCLTREDLELAIGLYGEALRRAVDNPSHLCLPEDFSSSDDEQCDEAITHLTKAWQHTFSRTTTPHPSGKNAMEQRLDALIVEMARDDMPPLNTVDAFMKALGDDWHTEVFTVHLLKSVGDKPVTLATTRVMDRLTKGAETQEWPWWKYHSDIPKFNTTMVWGKPHHVKTPQQGKAKRKRTASSS